MRQSIQAWIDYAKIENAPPPLDLDACLSEWPVEEANAVLCINVIHISPWSTCVGLVEGASNVLESGGVLYLYGPFSVDGVHISPGNAEFDETLKARDPAFGVRDVNEVTALADDNGFELERIVEMPANNLSVIYRKAHG